MPEKKPKQPTMQEAGRRLQAVLDPIVPVEREAKSAVWQSFFSKDPARLSESLRSSGIPREAQAEVKSIFSGMGWGAFELEPPPTLYFDKEAGAFTDVPKAAPRQSFQPTAPPPLQPVASHKPLLPPPPVGAVSHETSGTVVPLQPSGMSGPVTVAGRKGRFNFDLPPKKDGLTPGARYAFETEDGFRYYFQLEKEYQGGRWEDAPHAEADYQRLKGVPVKERHDLLLRQWPREVALAILGASEAGRSFEELKRRLEPLNTHRQISGPAAKPEEEEWQLGLTPSLRIGAKDFRRLGHAAQQFGAGAVSTAQSALQGLEAAYQGWWKYGPPAWVRLVLPRPAWEKEEEADRQQKFRGEAEPLKSTREVLGQDADAPGPYGQMAKSISVIRDAIAPAPEETERLFKDSPAAQFVFSDVPYGAGSTALFLVTGAVGAPTALTGALVGAGAAWEEADRRGAKGLSRWVYVLANGGVGTTERIPIARALDRFDSATGGALSKLLKNATKGAVEEYLQEFGQSMAEDISARLTIDPEREIGLKGPAYEGAVGAPIGSLMNMLTTAAGIRQRGSMKPGEKEVLESLAEEVDQTAPAAAPSSGGDIWEPERIPETARQRKRPNWYKPGSLEHAIAEQGGMRPSKEMRAAAGGKIPEEFRRMLRQRPGADTEAQAAVYLDPVYNPQGMTPDQMVEQLKAEGLVAPDFTVNELYEQLADRGPGVSTPSNAPQPDEEDRLLAEFQQREWESLSPDDQALFSEETPEEGAASDEKLALKEIFDFLDEESARLKESEAASETPEIPAEASEKPGRTPADLEGAPAAKHVPPPPSAPSQAAPLDEQSQAVKGAALKPPPAPVQSEIPGFKEFTEEARRKDDKAKLDQAQRSPIPMAPISGPLFGEPQQQQLPDLAESGREQTVRAGVKLLSMGVTARLQKGESLDNPKLTDLANKAFGGTRGEGAYTPRDAYDAVEEGVNRYIEASGDVHFDSPAETIARLDALTARLPRQADRTNEQIELQQFSTPPSEAFLAAWASGVRPGMTALEPSAGTGNIATMLRQGGAVVHANEIAPRRLEVLRRRGFFTSEVDASQLHNLLPGVIEPDIVVMNPPFSATGGRTKGHDTKHGARHVEQALLRLKDGGRLVAVVGRGMAHDRPGFADWWRKIERKYNVRANIGISGKHYGKYGTGFDNQLIVIDKTGPTPQTQSAPIDPGEFGIRVQGREVVWTEPGAPFPESVYATSEAGARRTAKQIAERLAGLRENAESTIIVADALSPAEAVPLLEPLAQEDVHGRTSGAESTDTSGEALRSRSGAAGRGQARPAPVAPPPPPLVERPGDRGQVDRGIERAPVADVGGGSRPDAGERAPSGGEPAGGRGGRPAAAAEPRGDEPVQRVAGVGDARAAGSGRLEQVDSVYAKYRVQKALHPKAQPHPAKVVESAALASVEPPPARYSPNLPEEIISEGRLSDLQLEAVTYAGQKHSVTLPDGQRAGYWIGDGCVAGDTRIYDPETGLHTAISDLAAAGKPITVLALTAAGFLKARAFAPFFKGIEPLYEIRLQSGRMVRVTARHKFLTPDGWLRLADGLNVGHSLASVEGPPANSLGFAPSAHGADDRRLTGTAQDSQAHCWSGSRLCDEQPLAAAKAVQVAAPSPTHLSKNSCAQAETRVPELHASGFSRHADEGNLQQSVASRPTARRALSSQARNCMPPALWAPIPVGSNDAASSCDLYSRWDRITSISFWKFERFYDMWVPGPENYVAEGVVHHNTGLGKGREVAGIIYDNLRQGRKRHLWMSANADLIADAQRDMEGVGVPAQLIAQRDSNTDADLPDQDGVLFTTYTLAAYEWTRGKRRFEQLKRWLGPDFDGVIAFDESHYLKNAVAVGIGGQISDKEGSQRGAMGLELMEAFPKARIVYVSATAATVPSNMGYMGRLGLWGAGAPFSGFPQFLQAMQRGGVGAMEMLARDLKAVGSYSGRVISYEGVEYGTVTHELTDEEIAQYDKVADFWAELQRAFDEAAETANQPKGGNRFTQFYAAQQRFFLMYMTALQTPAVIADAEKQLKAGRAVIISLFSTGAAQAERKAAQATASGGEIDMDITPRETLADLIERHFPTEEYIDVYDAKRGVTTKKKAGIVNRENVAKQAEMLDRLSEFSLPGNPLDLVVEHFGPSAVSELSRRQKRMERGKYVRRKIEGVSSAELNKHEAWRFQQGETNVAVISAAASTGISLHSDLGLDEEGKPRAKNRRRRVMYALQLSWSADEQMQAFGRGHRSNQASAPLINLGQTNLAGQKRLTNTTSRRLAGLGAIGLGSREALGGGLFDIEDITDEYGRAALLATYARLDQKTKEVLGVLTAKGHVQRNAETNVSLFLNRIMALPFAEQNKVFEDFYSRYKKIVEAAKAEGNFDTGVQKLKGEDLRLKGREVVHIDGASEAETALVELEGTFKVRKVPFKEVASESSFLRNNRSGKLYAATQILETKVRLTSARGLAHLVDVSDLARRFTLLPKSQAREEWDAELATIPDSVKRPVFLLTGAIFPIYDKVVGESTRTRVVRGDTDKGSLIGLEVDPKEITALKQRLGIGTPLGSASGQEVFDLVAHSGAIVELDNGWQVRPTRVHGEERVEVAVKAAPAREEMLGHGLFEEVIDYKKRWFVPLDPDEGPEAVSSLIERHKAVRDLTSAGPAIVGLPRLPDLRDAVGMPAKREAKLFAGEASPEDPVQDPVSNAPATVEISIPVEMEAPPLPVSLTGRLKTRFQKPVSTFDVLKALEGIPKAVNRTVPILFNRMTTKGQGEFHAEAEYARIKGAGNLRSATHEIGHALEKVVYSWPKGVPWLRMPAPVRKEMVGLAKKIYPSSRPDAGYLREGWAEFVYHYLVTDDARKEAPNLSKWFESQFLPDHKRIAEAILRARGVATQYRLQGALKRAEAAQKWGPTMRERFSLIVDLIGDWKTTWFETGTVYEKIDRIAEKALGRPLEQSMRPRAEIKQLNRMDPNRPVESPYELSRAFRKSASGIVRWWVEKGLTNLADQPVPGRPLMAAGDLVGGGRKGEVVFSSYLLARRTLFLAYGKDWESTMNSGGAAAMMLPPPGSYRETPMTVQDALWVYERLHTDKWAQAAEIVYEFNRHPLRYAVQGGLINQERFDRINSSLDYIPLQRVFDEIDPEFWKGLKIYGGDPLKFRLKGSQRRTKSPFGVMIGQAERIILQTQQRIVLDAILRLQNLPGMAEFVRKVPVARRPQGVSLKQALASLESVQVRRKQEGRASTATVNIADALELQDAIDAMVESGELPADTLEGVLRFYLPMGPPKGGGDPIVPYVHPDGKVEWFEVNPEVFSAFSGMDLFRISQMFGSGRWGGHAATLMEWVLAKPKRVFTLAWTGVRAPFQFYFNPGYDVQTLWMQTQTRRNPAQMLFLWLRTLAGIGWAGLNKAAGRPYRSEALEFRKRSGSDISNYLGIDQASSRKLGTKVFRGKIGRVVRHPYDYIADFFQVTESASRVTEIRALAKEIGYDWERPMTFAESIQLKLGGKEVTTPFDAGGTLSQGINMMAPFFQPNLQGRRMWARTLKNHPLRTLIYGLTTLTVPAMVLWWHNKDEEWWRDMTDIEKWYWNWLAPGGPETDLLLKIPKAREYGEVFVTAPVAIADAWYQQDPETAKRVMKDLFGGAIPEDMPEAVGMAKKVFEQHQIRAAAETVVKMAVPDPTPVLGRLLKEQLQNEVDWSGAPIVPRYQVDLYPGLQRGPYTTQLSQFLGDLFPKTVSPRRADHVLRSIFGGVGGDIMEMLGIGSPRRTRHHWFESVPVFGAAARKGGLYGTRSQPVEDLYREIYLEEQRYKSSRAEGKMETAEEARYRYLLQDAQDALRSLNKLEMELGQSGKYPKKLTEILRFKTRIAEDALSKKGIQPPPDLEFGVRFMGQSLEQKYDLAVDAYFAAVYDNAGSKEAFEGAVKAVDALPGPPIQRPELNKRLNSPAVQIKLLEREFFLANTDAERNKIKTQIERLKRLQRNERLKHSKKEARYWAVNPPPKK